MDKSAPPGKAGKKVPLPDQVETLVDVPGRSFRALSETAALPPSASDDEEAAADFLLHEEGAGEAAPPPASKPKPAASKPPQKRAPENVATRPVAHLGGTQAQDAEQEDSEDSSDEAAADPRQTRALEESAPAPPARPAAGSTHADAASAPPAKPTSGGAQKTAVLGDYRLLKKLGQGGMGTVYRAHQISLDREVAIKVLSKQLASKPAFVQRFLREARVMAKLDHPNILRCHEVGEALGF